MGKRILIVEDEAVAALALERTLEELGYEVLGSVATGEDALKRAATDGPDIVVMDIRLAGRMDGIDAAAKIRDSTGAQIIFMTGYDDEETKRRALALKPLGLMSKPIDKDEFEKYK
jgi:DNA-binding NarL/FixJ family response regulator